MPENPNNLETNSEEKPPFDQPHDSTETKDENDPFGIKSVGGGVVVLLIICGFLFIFAKLGEKGSDWIGENVNSAFNGKSEQEPAEEEKAGAKEPADEAETLAEKPKKSAVPQPVKPVPSTDGLSRTENAKVQLIDQLGGPKKVEIRHIAFSKDQEAMVVSLILLDGKSSKIEEVYFSQDEFDRYIPKPGSVISEDIKIWQNQ